MQRRALVAILLCLTIALPACGGNVPSPMLPTATPGPTQMVPTATPTPLPPPTVTSFPTVTPRGNVPALPTNGGQIPTAEPGTDTAPTADAGGVPLPTQPPPPTATPSGGGLEGYPAGVNLGQRIYLADFSVGWPTIDESTAQVYLSGGKYVFKIGPYDGRFMSTTRINERDMYVQVEVSPTECPEGGGYGLLFRYIDGNNYYLLTVYCNNTFSVNARLGGHFAQSPLASGPLPGGLDATSLVTHTLAVFTQGENFKLYFDRQEMGSLSDNRHEKGDVAVYGLSQSNGVLHVAFDNLEVWTVR